MPKRPDEAFFEGLGGTLPDGSVIERSLVPEPPDEPDVDEDGDELEEKYAQLSLRPVTKSNLFSHSEAHPYVLDLALLKAFGLEWMTWEPDTLFSEIQKTFSTSIADVNRVKIMAVMTLHVTDVFWEQWEVFENGVLAMNGIIPRINLIQPPDIPILLAGVDIANSIRKEEYSEEVARYSAACFMDDEVSYAPPPLDFCQKYLSIPRYHCLECGKHGSSLPPFDGHCDSCSRKFEDHPFNFKPEEGAKDDPSKVRYYTVLDPEPTKKRFEELLSLPPNKIEIREVAEDIEAATLVSATDYMEFRRQQLKRQLTEIKDWMAPS